MPKFGEQEIGESQGAEETIEKSAEEITVTGNDEITDGVSKYLSEYDYADGVIPFEEEVEGEMKTVGRQFNDLTEVEKYDVLKTLSDSKLEGKYDLNEDELKIVETLREKEMSFDELVNSQIDTEVEKVKNHYEVQSVDYKNMSNDILMTKSLTEKYKDESSEDIQERLKVEKDLEGYEKKVSITRDAYLDAQELDKDKVLSELKDQALADTESDRKSITNEVIGMDDIDGWRLTDEDKNDVLEDILEVGENGYSKFYNEIFSDPKKMFRAAYLYKNANTLFNNQEASHNKKLTKAVLEAKSSVLDGSSISKDRSNFTVNHKKKVEETPGGEKKPRVFGS